MALSFGRALLAGAAGVAEYSNEEQQRRQARIDRTQQLRDNMQLEQAKSKYASRYNSYERDNQILDQLGDTDPNSPMGQLALLMAYNPKLDAATASVMISKGRKVKVPQRGEEPVFDMPEFQDPGRAVSPIEDWFNGYSNASERKKKLAQATYEQFIAENQGQTESPLVGQAMGDYQPPVDPQAPLSQQGPQGTLEPMGGAGVVPDASEGSIEPMGVPTYQDRASEIAAAFNPVKADPTEYDVKWTVAYKDGKEYDRAISLVKNNPNAEPIIQDFDKGTRPEDVEYEYKWTDTIKNDMEHETVIILDKKNPNNKPTILDFPKGKHAFAALPVVTEVDEEGREVITEQYSSKADVRRVITGRKYLVETKDSRGLTGGGSDSPRPVKLVKHDELNKYISTDEKSPGQLYVDWLPTELENLELLNKSDNWFGQKWENTFGGKPPEGMVKELANNYLNVRQADIDAGNVYPEDVKENFAELNDMWKALALYKTLGTSDRVLEAIELGAVDPRIFYSPEIDNVPLLVDFQQLLRESDIKPKYSEKPTKY